MKKLFVSFAALLLCSMAIAQAKQRRMPNNINLSGQNLYAPFISADGNHLLYLSDYTEDRTLTIMYSQRVSGTWRDAVDLPRHINNRLNYVYGFALNADASMLLITSGRSGGVGKYDIWYSERRGNSWAEPQNFGTPLNSAEHDGCPSLTPDGNVIYFMRCEQMTGNSASNCKIFSSRKIRNTWEEPVELPAHINTGNSQCPRIMADGETLIFSSDKMPGAKGFDLYMTKNRGGTWTQPIAMEFANTELDDICVSASSSARYLMKSIKQQRHSELFELLFPDHQRPSWILRLEGKVVNASGNAAEANINIFNAQDNKRITTASLDAEGNFSLFLKEGLVYDISVEPKNGTHTFGGHRYDLTLMEGPLQEKFETVIKPVYPNDVIELQAIQFRPYSHVMDDASELEIRRLSRFILDNKNYDFEIAAHHYNYLEDSLLSSPDLTEILIDTVYYEKEIYVDSLNRSVILDSVAYEYIYHNDRSARQAKSVFLSLLQHGVPESQLRYAGYREEYDQLLSKRSPVIRVRVLKKPQ